MSPIPQHVRAICFDAVGTLIIPDPPAHLVYAEAGQKFGSRYDAVAIRCRFREAFAAEEKRDLQGGLQTSEEREHQRWRHIVATVLDDVADPEQCFQELYHHFRRPESWQCDLNAGAVLQRLASRYPLALASNYDSRLRSVMAGLPQLRSISHVIISSEVGWRKPAAPFFEAVCRTLNLELRQVLFVGDDPVNDYQGAVAAGLEALLFAPKGPEMPGVRCIGDLRRLLSS
jgi:putative hydrolase of the HAD superfamily